MNRATRNFSEQLVNSLCNKNICIRHTRNAAYLVILMKVKHYQFSNNWDNQLLPYQIILTILKTLNGATDHSETFCGMSHSNKSSTQGPISAKKHVKIMQCVSL